jgi:hypothetical protein
VQRQEPYVSAKIDSETKILSLSNTSFVPISTKVYSVWFEIDLLEKINPERPYDVFKVRGAGIVGTVMPRKILWFSKHRTFDLLTDSRFAFSTEISMQNRVYCFVLEERNILSNQTKIETMTISAAPPELFGGLNQGTLGMYEFFAALFKADDAIREVCRSMYSRISGA